MFWPKKGFINLVQDIFYLRKFQRISKKKKKERRRAYCEQGHDE